MLLVNEVRNKKSIRELVIDEFNHGISIDLVAKNNNVTTDFVRLVLDSYSTQGLTGAKRNDPSKCTSCTPSSDKIQCLTCPFSKM